MNPGTPEPLDLEEIVARIVQVAPRLHGAGTLSDRALRAIASHASKRRILHSVETGAGASTLLLSHLSPEHTVFAIDDGASIAAVRRSPLLRPDVVTFVEGPTQVTLPRHHFQNKLQLALIDGPHAYPFPDLEYYYLYPQLDAGALLIVDDIHIRTINNLFEFLSADAMYELREVVDKTAFFTRTDAPVFDPVGDNWWAQNYNAKPKFRYVWKARLAQVLPGNLRRRLSRGRPRAHSANVRILAPTDGALVSEHGIVEGTAALPADAYLWILVHRKDMAGWWPQAPGPVTVDQGRWSASVKYGEPQDAGHKFEIAALIVPQATHEFFLEFGPVALPPPRDIVADAYKSVRKRG